MSEPPTAAHPFAERLAEVRGEHGWARYVDDETLVAWIRRTDRFAPTGWLLRELLRRRSERWGLV